MPDMTIEIRKRVVEEYSELNHRLGKLKSFIGTVTFMALPVEQRAFDHHEGLSDVIELHNLELQEIRFVIFGACPRCGCDCSVVQAGQTRCFECHWTPPQGEPWPEISFSVTPTTPTSDIVVFQKALYKVTKP